MAFTSINKSPSKLLLLLDCTSLTSTSKPAPPIPSASPKNLLMLNFSWSSQIAMMVINIGVANERSEL